MPPAAKVNFHLISFITMWVHITKPKCDQFLSKISSEKCQISLYCLHYAKAWIVAKLLKDCEMTFFSML